MARRGQSGARQAAGVSVEELRETLVFLAPYAGYPNVAPLVGVTERAIAEANPGPEAEPDKS